MTDLSYHRTSQEVESTSLIDAINEHLDDVLEFVDSEHDGEEVVAIFCTKVPESNDVYKLEVHTS